MSLVLKVENNKRCTFTDIVREILECDKKYEYKLCLNPEIAAKLGRHKGEPKGPSGHLLILPGSFQYHLIFIDKKGRYHDKTCELPTFLIEYISQAYTKHILETKMIIPHSLDVSEDSHKLTEQLEIWKC